MWAAIALITRTTQFSSIKPEAQLFYQLAISAIILLPLSMLGETFTNPTPLHFMIFAAQVVFVVCNFKRRTDLEYISRALACRYWHYSCEPKSPPQSDIKFASKRLGLTTFTCKISSIVFWRKARWHLIS